MSSEFSYPAILILLPKKHILKAPESNTLLVAQLPSCARTLQHHGLLPARLLWFMGILQARILECVAMPSSRGSSQPRDQFQVFCIADELFTV